MTGPEITRRGALLVGAELAALAALWQLAPPTALRLAAAAPTTGRLKVFDYQGVRLLPSRWQTQQNDVLSYYMAVPDARYLVGFRKRAGKTLPEGSYELGGWYSGDGFNCFGQIVSGLARFHAGTGRADVKDRVNALVAGFAECIDPDTGFFFYSDSPNATHYGYDKVLCGMLDAWQYCGDTNARDAIPRITGWAEANLAITRNYGGDYAEWYTLAENLFRTFLATGDARYREFAQLWEYHGFWGRFYRGEDWFLKPDGTAHTLYHAYSHVNALNGLGAGHFAVGGDYFRDALAGAYDAVRASQIYTTGGYGPVEALLKDRQVLKDLIRTPFTHHHFETQCGSWAVFKLVKYLLLITGDGRFGDWAEQMLYNGVGASMQSRAPTSATGPGGGEVQYFSDYSSRGGSKFLMNAWSCCSGTRPQAVADYTDLVFLNAPGELAVNLFLPATLDWPSGGVRARLETTFPASDVVRLTIEQAPASELTVKFRNPGWLAGTPVVKVNGGAVTVTPAANWLPVRRAWRAGDEVEVTLPTGTRPRLDRFDPATAHPAALVQGPVVLAYSATSNPVRNGSAQAVLDSLQRIPGTLDYRIGATGPAVVKPFYAYGGGQRYFMYLDPAAGPYISHGGAWTYNAIWRHPFTKASGAWAEATFEGTGIRWSWQRAGNNGLARVEIDGVVVQTVDMYGPWGPANSDFTGLSAGQHRIRIVCTGQKNPSSSDTYINITDIAYLD